ncbi:MAG: hypothetical protein PHX83_13780 [Acidobacteriia bacterium]|nr:hypothetical protein [Terriglobia bacterium]
MNCAFCRNQLEEFLDGRLDKAATEVYQFHIDHCESCRERLDDALLSRSVTRSAVPAEACEASASFFSQVWQKIEAERAETFSWWAVRGLAVRFAVAVAAIIILLIGADALTAPRLNENQAALESYLEAPGAPEAFRDVLIGDLGTNRDQLLQNLLIRDRQMGSAKMPHESPAPVSTQKKTK